MAGPMELDTGQFLTYLSIYALPHIIVKLTRQAIPKDRAFYKILLLRQAWLPQGHRCLVPHKKVKRYKKKPASIVPEGVSMANKLRTFLLLLAMASFWVGCCVESLARRLCPCAQAPLHLRALQSLEAPSQPPPLLFDSDSFPIGIDNHASRCMANAPHLFEDLRLTPKSQESGWHWGGIGGERNGHVSPMHPRR
jgi:hypothetical protein